MTIRTPFAALFIGLCLLLSMPSAVGQVSVSIGINVPVYPELVRVPGYPVYYAPRLGTNYFFYDGMYWVLQGDNWYASSWYNGPWAIVAPYDVPVFVLRVPVRYYRVPPPYFRGWRPEAPPHWGERFGHDWERQRPGWNHWDRRAAPPPAPLPVYQRRYPADRYPPAAQQPQLHERNYRYQPREPVVQQMDPTRRRHGEPANDAARHGERDKGRENEGERGRGHDK